MTLAYTATVCLSCCFSVYVASVSVSVDVLLLSRWLSALFPPGFEFSPLDDLFVGLLLMLGRDAWTSDWDGCMERVLTVCSHLLSVCPIWRFVQVVILCLFCLVSYLSIRCCSSSVRNFLVFCLLFVCFLALRASLFLLCCVLFVFLLLCFFSAGCACCLLEFWFQRLSCCCCHVAAGRRVIAAIAFCDTVGVLEEVLRG